MDSKRKNSDFNPYDLNQVGKARKRLPKIRIRIRSRVNDPYSASSLLQRKK